ncbi:hypothetical protein D3C72_1278560 [compost metagenome]
MLAMLMVALARIAAQVAVAGVLAGHIARQLGQCHLVHAALELHHHIERHPVIVPAPGIELGVVGGTQIQVPIVAG